VSAIHAPGVRGYATKANECRKLLNEFYYSQIEGNQVYSPLRAVPVDYTSVGRRVTGRWGSAACEPAGGADGPALGERRALKERARPGRGSRAICVVNPRRVTYMVVKSSRGAACSVSRRARVARGASTPGAAATRASDRR
jgi:hypothetical protein